MWPLGWAYANRLLNTVETDGKKLGCELTFVWAQTLCIFLSAIPTGAYILCADAHK